MITRPATSNINPAAYAHTHLQESLLIIKAKKNPNYVQHVYTYFTTGLVRELSFSAPHQETLAQA